jgi:hypothetical protein
MKTGGVLFTFEEQEITMRKGKRGNHVYQDIPLHFTWDRKNKIWRRRRRDGSIGRIYFVSPTAGERFYLRTLLTTVKGPTSYENLRTFDSVLHPSFHAACLARGLLENDDEWRQCLLKASLTHVGESLRRLFSLILRHCQPSEPHVLWEEFKDNLCDDLGRREHKEHFEKLWVDELVYGAAWRKHVSDRVVDLLQKMTWVSETLS